MTEDDDSPLSNVKQQLEQSEQQGAGDDVDDKEGEEEQKHAPPFPFSESKQNPLYPHQSRWDEWEDAKFEAEGLLRKNGVRDVHGREFDDALLKLGIQNPEQLAEIILKARGIQPSEEQ